MNFIYALMFALSPVQADTTIHYCPKPKRSSSVVAKFKRETGFPKGRPGYIVDHKVPLCACGKDNIANLQWQPRDSSLMKDVHEKRLCTAIANVVKLNRKSP